MSVNDEQIELAALADWMKTFPQFETFANDKENTNVDILSDARLASFIFDVALEVSNCDGDETAMSHASDVWDNIASIAQKNAKRKYVESPSHGKSKSFSKHTALADLLDGAVSHPNIELRKAYVQRIMKLPGETQRTLMSLIARRKKPESSGRRDKKVKTVHAPDETTNTPAKQRSAPEIASAGKPGRSPFTPRNTRTKCSMVPGSAERPLLSTPRRIFQESSSKFSQLEEDPCFGLFSPGLGDSAEYEREVRGLREQNDQLRIEIESYRRKEDEMKEQLEEKDSKFRNEMMKVEASSRRRENETRESLEAKVRALDAELQEMRHQSDDAEQAKAELARVKDEMELMMHTKSLLEDTTERLNICKEKLQQLTDVKEALQREEEAHSRSVDENLRLQNELTALQPLRRQLEDYKTRAVEAEVSLTETQDELNKLHQQRRESSDTNENLMSTIRSQEEEITALRRRIKDEEYGQKARGLGEGISELNPEIKEELLRLRNENAQLKTFAEKRQDDAVAKLELEAEDTRRLSERYKSQFLSTKGTLETALLDLQESAGREEVLKKKFAETADELKGTRRQLQESAEQLARTNANLEASRTRESKLAEELSSWVEQARILQERTDDMTRRLQQCSRDLKESLDRESDLKDSVASWMDKFEDCTKQVASMSKQLDIQSTELHDVRTREEELAQDMSEWIEKAKLASELANDISDQLKSCSEELNDSRSTVFALQNTLDEVSTTLRSTEIELNGTKQRLSHAQVELKEKQRKLKEAHEDESRLQHQVAAVTSHAEGIEDSLKMTKEEVEKLKLELLNSENDVKTLTLREGSLVSEVEDLENRLDRKTREIETFQTKLQESNELNVRTQNQLDIRSDEMKALKERSAVVNDELDASKKRNAVLDLRIVELQEELSTSQEALLQNERALQLCHNNEKDLIDQLNQTIQLTHELENSLKEETESKVQVEEELAIVCDANWKMEKELKDTIASMRNELEAEKRHSVDSKKDLQATLQALHDAENALGASRHREKMLQHKATVLEDQERELQEQIEAERKKVENEIQEAERSLDATREALNTKAAKDMHDLQTHMNQLLEDERKAKRQAEQACQQKIKKLQEDLNNEISNIRQAAVDEKDAMRKDATQRAEEMKEAYEAKLAKLKAHAEEESTKLVRKGKTMLRELKAQKQEDIDKLNEEFSALEEKYTLLKGNNETMAAQFKAKASEYKKKLHFASGRISRLTTESDELEQRISGLEREKYKLREENDRYRRQLGGRFGSDSNGQNQLETLQKELKNACDEIRELKRQQRNGENNLPSIDEVPESADQSYSRDVATHSTISQLRNDYEEALEALNDEKRELVMRNSAAITDIQKAEKRAWESEQENAALQQELTSLKLQLERLGNTEVKEDNSFYVGFKEQSSANLSIKDEPTSFRSSTSAHEDGNVTMEEPQAIESPPVPFTFGPKPQGDEDRPPECQQS
eukprot:scaffold11977_cov107-Cylindrotheca_fusiformis.AAC.6